MTSIQIKNINNPYQKSSFRAQIPQIAINYKEQGNEYLKFNDFDKAIECYNKAISYSSDYADAWFSIPEVDFFGNTNGGEPLTDNQISLTAGQTVTIAVADWAYGTAGITFTATIA